jgi:hypothetical protein
VLVEGDEEAIVQSGFTVTAQAQDVVSYPSLIVAVTAFDPTKVASGAKTAWLVPEPFVIVKYGEATAFPLFCHVNVSGSEFASLPFAPKVKVCPDPKVFPLAPGVCEEHTGGEFLTTVHDCDAVLVPFVTETASVLFPVDKLDDGTE